MQYQEYLQASAPRKKASPWWDFLSHCKGTDDSSSDSDDDSPQEIDDKPYANHNDTMTCNTGPTNSTNDDLLIKESAPVKSISIGARSKSKGGENDGEAAQIHPQTPRTEDSSFSSYEARSSSSSIPDYNEDDHAFEVSSFQSIEVDEGDDDYSFIGNIDIMPISSFLSSQQRNIRKNAYNLLMRLGDEESMFDLNSTVEIEAEVDVDVGRERQEEGNNYSDDKLQRQKQQQQVESLKRQLGECKEMVEQLHANLCSYSNYATDDDDVTSVGINNDDDQKDDDVMADLRSEIVNLKKQLQSATLQSRLMFHESINFHGRQIHSHLQSVGD